MVSSIVAALAAASIGACPTPVFVPHDGALRFSAIDLALPGEAPSLNRALTTSLPFRGQFGIGFGIEEELRVEPLPGGALRVTVPGPCPACAAAIPDASPEALSEAVGAAARTLVASGVSALAGEAAAYAQALAQDPAFRQARWATRRDAWLVAAREEPADKLERLPVAARYRVVPLPSGYLRFSDGVEVQELDPEGRLRRVVNAAGLVREIQRDEAGRIVRVADAFGRGFGFELDGAGRVVRATGTNGAVVTYGYDGVGRLVWTEDREGRTELGWDDVDRVVRLTCQERVFGATYESPAEGGRVTSLDSDGTRERYVYQGSAGGLYRAVTVYSLPEPAADPELRPEPATDDDGADASGAPVEHGLATDHRGPAPDEVPRPLRRYTFFEPMTSDGRRWTWQAVEEEQGDAKVTLYDDRTFQPLSVAASDRVARLEYDGLGRITRKVVAGETTTVTYGVEGKVVRIAHEAGQAEDGQSYEVRYAYDARARLVTAQRGDDAARVTYDDRGRISTLATRSASTESNLSFVYGNDDRPLRIASAKAGALAVEYDANGDVRNVNSKQGRRAALEVTSSFQTLLDLVRPASVRAEVW